MATATYSHSHMATAAYSHSHMGPPFKALFRTANVERFTRQNTHGGLPLPSMRERPYNKLESNKEIVACSSVRLLFKQAPTFSFVDLEFHILGAYYRDP